MTNLKAINVYLDLETIKKLHKKREEGYRMGALIRKFIKKGLQEVDKHAK